MRYSINLATRTYLDQRQFTKLFYLLLFCLLLALAWNVRSLTTYMGKISRLKEDIARMEGKTGSKVSAIPEAEAAQQKALVRFYNEIIERKSNDWLALLDTLESATPEGIAIASLSQDKKNGEWKLDGRARSFKMVQKYLEQLETSKNFTNIMLLSHQNMTSGEKGQGIQFTISCKVVR